MNPSEFFQKAKRLPISVCSDIFEGTIPFCDLIFVHSKYHRTLSVSGLYSLIVSGPDSYYDNQKCSPYVSHSQGEPHKSTSQ